MRRGALVFAAVLVLAGAGCGSDGGGELSGSLYTLELASGWEETTDQAPPLSEITGDPDALGISLDSTATATDAEGEFAPNLAIVTTRDIRGVKDSIELAEVNLRTARESGSLPSAAGGGAVDAVDAEVEEVDLGGEPAGSYEQVAEAPQGEIRQQQIFIIHGETAYAITYSALEGEQYDQYLPEVELMLDSWTWEGSS